MTDKANSIEIETLTSNYICKINKNLINVAKTWVEQGRLIKDYIDTSKLTEDKCLRKLAHHKDSLIGISQLRNYMVAYTVHEEVKNEISFTDLSMTHFIVVQKKNLSTEDRKNLLLKAKNENMSVSSLKKEIASSANQPQNNSITEEKLRLRVEKLLADFSKFNDEQENNTKTIKPEVSDNFKDTILILLNYATEMKWVDFPFPIDKNETTETVVSLESKEVAA
ncbi:hypothetical protein P3T73_03320 [Kiritimatiellota bacterium B12222]|nr:hypothetical protein P3T73_03320 [Kiritimatiellota bacterium B12222]